MEPQQSSSVNKHLIKVKAFLPASLRVVVVFSMGYLLMGALSAYLSVLLLGSTAGALEDDPSGANHVKQVL